jgi:hypothetical protein
LPNVWLATPGFFSQGLQPTPYITLYNMRAFIPGEIPHLARILPFGTPHAFRPIAEEAVP